MIITILWEDQRGHIVKGFGPHELLVSSVADDVKCSRLKISRLIHGIPKKGNTKVVNSLKMDLTNMTRSGPVCAVLDRDKVLDLWKSPNRPADCITGIKSAIAKDAPGEYELLLLDENVETLIKVSCSALQIEMPPDKPAPDERDRVLNKAAWGIREVRARVRKAIPSFDRLVKWADEKARKVLQSSDPA